MPEIVPVYAGLLGLLFVYLSIRVIRARRQSKWRSVTATIRVCAAPCAFTPTSPSTFR